MRENDFRHSVAKDYLIRHLVIFYIMIIKTKTKTDATQN